MIILMMLKKGGRFGGSGRSVILQEFIGPGRVAQSLSSPLTCQTSV